VKEEKGKFYPIGVENAENIIKDLWDNLNNSKKVSSISMERAKMDSSRFRGKL
jgi:hypothetical protein